MVGEDADDVRVGVVELGDEVGDGLAGAGHGDEVEGVLEIEDDLVTPCVDESARKIN